MESPPSTSQFSQCIPRKPHNDNIRMKRKKRANQARRRCNGSSMCLICTGFVFSFNNMIGVHELHGSHTGLFTGAQWLSFWLTIFLLEHLPGSQTFEQSHLYNTKDIVILNPSHRLPVFSNRHISLALQTYSPSPEFVLPAKVSQTPPFHFSHETSRTANYTPPPRKT